MKRYTNLYQRILSPKALQKAYRFSRKNKKPWVTAQVDANPTYYLAELKKMLEDGTFKTSKYEVFNKTDSGKLRKIANLPYYPDRIAQCVYVQEIIEPVWIPVFIETTYSAIPNRGQTAALIQLNEYLDDDPEGTMYVVKMDIKKYFDSIDKNILKEIFARKIKDKRALAFAYEIIDSWQDTGIPIGNYTSQYFGNIYLCYFDHWVKEVLGVKYYLRYMDDLIILVDSKERGWEVYHAIKEYLKNELGLILKPAQPHPVEDRGVDFVGYRSFHDYILVRNKTKRKAKHKCLRIQQKIEKGEELNEHDRGVIASYEGVFKWGDCHRLRDCTIGRL